MAKKSMIKEATDAAKSVAAAALGAAAIAATGVIVTRVAGAIRDSGKNLEESAPEIQKLAADTVTKPILPKKKTRSATIRKAASVRKPVITKKAAKKSARKGARKKR
jgi:hypothetical protein